MKDLSDISARFKKKREEQAGSAPEERNYAELYALRARVLGVLIRDARVAHGDTLTEVAAELRIPETTLEDWELGNSSPGLPQLELLAYILEVPVSQFWRNKLTSTTGHTTDKALPVPIADYADLRNRVIGIRLAVARKEARLSLEEVGTNSGLTTDQVAAFESGQYAIPFPVLTALAMAVRRSIGYFLEDTGRMGIWLRLQEEYERFSQLPDEIRAFVTQPVNQPFIEIAMKLSQMPLQELRAVGEKILDITL